MNLEQSTEQKIAKYLEDNKIDIIPIGTTTKEALSFMQYRTEGPVEIGELTYDLGKDSLCPPSIDEVKKRLKVEGFINNVIRPLSRLFVSAKGNFYNENFDPIHDALDRIESQYN